MVYETDWRIESQGAANQATVVIRTLNEALERYMEWQTFRAARSDADIATELGRTESEVAELDACFSAFKEIYDFANNVASPTQGDRYYSMRVFS